MPSEIKFGNCLLCPKRPTDRQMCTRQEIVSMCAPFWNCFLNLTPDLTISWPAYVLELEIQWQYSAYHHSVTHYRPTMFHRITRLWCASYSNYALSYLNRQTSPLNPPSESLSLASLPLFVAKENVAITVPLDGRPASSKWLLYNSVSSTGMRQGALWWEFRIGSLFEEGKRAFMEPDLPRPWADTAQPYATCWTVDGVLLQPGLWSERGGGRGNECWHELAKTWQVG